MNEPRLETERLTLRLWRASDFEPFAAMCADEEVMRYVGGKTLTRPEAWRFMALVVGHWHLKGFGMWAVEERDGGELVGRVGCWQPEGWPGFELGWVLRREFWGRGFATEAARAALRHAFDELEQTHVISLIHPDNRASIRVAERLGEKLEGRTEVFGMEVSIYGIER